MSKIILISDLHLGSRENQKDSNAVAHREEKLIELFRQWEVLEGENRISHVILVGDVFEFWMEYKDYIPKYQFAFLAALKSLVEHGVEVHYIAGNHDFLLEDFFEQQLGVKTHENFILEAQDKRFYFQHGDGINKNDWGYRIARKVITNPINIFLFKLLHPDWGMSLARLVSNTSREHIIEDDDFQIQYRKSAQELAEKHDVDFVVFGHTHTPEITEQKNMTYINTGQWYFKLNYVEIEAGQARIVKVDPK